MCCDDIFFIFAALLSVGSATTVTGLVSHFFNTQLHVEVFLWGTHLSDVSYKFPFL